MIENQKKLYKSIMDKKIDGVCGGIGEYFEMDSTIVRIAWVIFACLGAGVLAYIICMLVIPRKPLNMINE